jgi:molecular chaperone GrpE
MVEEGVLKSLESRADIKMLREKIQSLQNQTLQIAEEIEKTRKLVAENCEKYGPEVARISTEYERMKARSKEESQLIAENVKLDALKDILPILDNYLRAKKALQPETPREKEILHAYDQIFELLEKEIIGFGLTKIETVGNPYDYSMMEAVMRTASDYPEDVVCRELQIGYKMGSRCVRPAMVAVSSGSF